MPRYRQRLAFVPFGQGRPRWVDDPHLNLRYHVRSTALPAPGSEEQLKALAGRVFSQQLDRDKPLWEIWLVEGLEGDRFAMLSKTHHALVDGVSGVDIMTVLFDTSPEPAAPTDAGERWLPRPLPSGAQLLGEALRRARDDARPRSPARCAPSSAARAGRRRRCASRRRRRRDGLGRASTPRRPALQPADRPAPPLHLGAREPRATSRRSRTRSAAPSTTWCWPPWPARSAATCAAAASDTDGLELKAMVPVSVRAEDERGALGNQVAAMMAPLPVWCQDPVARLDIVREELKGLKSGGQAVGAQVLTELSGFAPPTIMGQASRLMSRQRFFNLVVTNVPGPAVPALPDGQRLIDPFPMVPLAQNQALGIAMLALRRARSTSASSATTT